MTDAEGREWALGEMLGEGGEGEVYAVAGHPVAVKLLFNATAAALRTRLEGVSRLPLGDLPIAGVHAMLAPPTSGYVMRLITETQPWRDMLPLRVSSLTRWYEETGGLRRRLELLALLAEALAALHGRGIAYRDLSPNNVLVSPPDEAPGIWLIDPDNLRYTTEPRKFYGTPWYVAPELARGDITSPDALTDAHSFAVLMFHTLSTAHPLLDGDLVDEDDALQLPALRGELPWVGHATDDRNRTTKGFPSEIVLTARLRRMAAQAFDAGLRDAAMRPRMHEWSAAMRAATDLCLTCVHCGRSFFPVDPDCPWCGGPRPAFARLTFGIWCGEAGLGLARRHEFVVGAGDGRRIRASLARPWDEDAGGDVAEVEHDEGVIRYRALTSGTWLGRHGGGRDLQVGAQEEFRVAPGKAMSDVIHFGPPDEPHRAVRLSIRPSGR